MYCPGCGSEERQMSQYCRACGTDLRSVRVSLERPDSVTASAITAREEIGRVFAEKIREVEDSRDLKRIAEDVLPQIEKFLESPEEKRLRRMRAGVVTAAIGLGAGIPSALIIALLSKTDDALPFLGMMFILSLVTFMLGLGLVINGRMLTQPPRELKDNSADAQAQIHLDAGYAPPQLRPGDERPELFRSPATSDLAAIERQSGSSVTEHTTQHLKREP